VQGRTVLRDSRENLTLTGTGNINATLTGLAGNDRMTGAGGNDTFVFREDFGREYHHRLYRRTKFGSA
jgi:Ca2+-binding RTX toxin-like protein